MLRRSRDFGVAFALSGGGLTVTFCLCFALYTCYVGLLFELSGPFSIIRQRESFHIKVLMLRLRDRITRLGPATHVELL